MYWNSGLSCQRQYVFVPGRRGGPGDRDVAGARVAAAEELPRPPPRIAVGAAGSARDTRPGNQPLSSSTVAAQETSNCADRAVSSGRHNGSTSTSLSNSTLPNNFGAKLTRSSAASRN